MRIWITGGAGFLGQRLAQRFSALGHTVIGLSRRKSAHAYKSIEIDLSADDALLRLEALRDETGVPDVVIHTASRQPGVWPLSEFVKSNVLATANLWEALKIVLPGKVIYTSTLSVYDLPAENPVSETQAAGGSQPYSATKRWAEQICESFCEQTQVIILRLPSLYGAGQADSFVDGLARLALRDEPIELFSRGQLIRDALHVNDVEDAIAACVELPSDAISCLMNLGSGRQIRTIEYAKALVEALDSKSEIVPIDRSAAHFDLYADIDIARRLIGFNPTGLHESMKRYANELRT
jgi:nucleoside-diphosphate-sugar epimerase